MKKYFLFLAIFLVSVIIAVSGCNSKEVVKPCDDNGTVYILNKLDTNVTVSITQMHNTFIVHKDENKSVLLLGNQAYTFSFSSINFQKDTTIFLLPCDNTLLTVKQ